MTFSLSSLSDFTATPGPAKSNIASKELIGNAKFPELLGGFQSNAAGLQASLMLGDAKGAGPDFRGADLKGPELESQPVTQGAEFNDFAALEAPAYGNAFPQPGTDLPPGLQGGLKGDGFSSNTEQTLNLPQSPAVAPVAALVEISAAIPAASGGDASLNIEADKRLVTRADSPPRPLAPRETLAGTQADLRQINIQATQQGPEAATNTGSDIRAALLNAARRNAPSDVSGPKAPPQALTQAGMDGPSVSAISGGEGGAEPALPVRRDELRQTIPTERDPDLSVSSPPETLKSLSLNSPVATVAAAKEPGLNEADAPAPQDGARVRAKGETFNSPSPPTLKSLDQTAPTATPPRLEVATDDLAPAFATSKAAKMEQDPAAPRSDAVRGERLGDAKATASKPEASQPTPTPAPAPTTFPAPVSAQAVQEPSAKVEGTVPQPNLAPAHITQTVAVTSLAAKIAGQAPRLSSASDIRVQSELGASRAGAVSGDLTQTQIQNGNLPQTAVSFTDGKAGGEAASDPQRGPSSTNLALTLTPQSAAQSAGEVSAEVKASQAPSQTGVTQPQAAALPPAQPVTQVPVTDTSAALRLGPQLENAIEQLADTRSNAQANRPELTVRHSEFGAITVRLENTGLDLRATLSARDPGFVPAIQTALAERGIAAAGETSNANGNKGGDQSGSNNGSHNNSGSGTFGGSQGHGWNSQGAYGSSTGSGQGTSQPYTGQTDGRDEELGSDPAGRTLGQGDGPRGEGEVFA